MNYTRYEGAYLGKIFKTKEAAQEYINHNRFCHYEIEEHELAEIFEPEPNCACYKCIGQRRSVEDTNTKV